MTQYIHVSKLNESSNKRITGKIAAFDIDSTIIRIKSGRRYPLDHNDWEFWDPSVPALLRSLNRRRYNIVFFSNQGGIQNKKEKRALWIKKVKNIVAKLDIPIDVFAATHYNSYRKPGPSMWRQYLAGFDHLVRVSDSKLRFEVDFKKSFFCGDAAGRPATKEKKADFSDSDIKFALNNNLSFFTPEQYFQGVIQNPIVIPQSIPEKIPLSSVSIPDQIPLSTYMKQMVMFVGFPGAGKSSARERFGGGVTLKVINQDEMKTKAKCFKNARLALSDNCLTGVLVDNTNLTKVIRKEYIKIAREYKAIVRCVHFTTSRKRSEHNVKYRNLVNPKRKAFPFRFVKKIEMPSLSEGFESITKVPWIPRKMPPDYYLWF